jgi:signal transduction histidine kinase
MSIRGRLLVSLLAGLGLLAVAGSAFLYWCVGAALSRQFDAALLSQARAIGNLLRQERDGKIEFDFSAESMPEFAAREHSHCFFELWDNDGTVLERSPSLGNRDLPLPADGGDSAVWSNFAGPRGRSVRAIVLRLNPPMEDEDPRESSKPSHAGKLPVAVMVAQDRHELDETMWILLCSLLATAALVGAGVAVTVTIAVRKGLRPLDRVADEVGAIDAQSLQNRFSTESLPRELRPICAGLNGLLGRLEDAFERERRFTADVAHELRTPIAELRTLAEVAVRWQHDPETVATFFNDASQVASQMDALVSALLALARCQAGQLSVGAERVALAELIDDAWRLLRPQAERRNLRLSLQIPGSAAVIADRMLLSAIIANLLSNAVEYAPIGGELSCETHSDGDWMSLTVANDHDTLAPADLPHLFEAFWRKDKARTSSTHSGLGLTLAAAYAATLGGKIDAAMPNGHTVSITLQLPIHPVLGRAPVP